jgi:outer membrane protein assembly factor BamB
MPGLPTGPDLPIGAAIWRDFIFVNPGTGFLAAVGRFDGKLRWLRPVPGDEDGRPSPVRYDARPRVVEGSNAASATVVVAPPGQSTVAAFDALTGEDRWSESDRSRQTLIGTCGDLVILVGKGLSALDAVTGRERWSFDLPRGGEITGPAVVVGDVVWAPTEGGAFAISAKTGEPVESADAGPPGPSVATVVKSPAAKAALKTIDATTAFGSPSHRAGDDE